MTDPIRRELRALKLYSAFTTVVFAVLLFAAFRQGGERQRFEEIDVERINVVEPDGSYRMVISNRPRSIGPIYKGEPFGYPGGTRPGIIFFNDEGTENGGLTFTGSENADGTYASRLGMSFDQFNQDQVVVLEYADQNGAMRKGLTIGDRAHVDIFDLVQQRDSIMASVPAGDARDSALAAWAQPRDGVPLYAPRVFIGRDPNRASVLNLADPTGRPRLRLRVDSLGVASIEFLDESGQVTARLPGSGQ